MQLLEGAANDPQCLPQQSPAKGAARLAEPASNDHTSQPSRASFHADALKANLTHLVTACTSGSE